MNQCFNTLDVTLKQLTQQELTLRIDVAELVGSNHETCIIALETSLEVLKLTNEKLLRKVNLEGHSRRNNIKIVGIPEGEEKGRPTDFVAALLPTLGPATYQIR